MKAVILAGGLGTRLSEETVTKPKPMVEIGGKPILWHIMKIYSYYGINDFIICCGYKGYVIKEFFANYFLHQSDVTFDLKTNKTLIHSDRSEPWTVTLVDTGETSMTGGRLKRALPYVKDEEAFCFTYGDGVADINIARLIEFHKSHGKLATLTSTYAPGRFGALNIIEDQILKFEEKPRGDGSLINGGFFVLSPDVIDKIADDECVWEQKPLKELAQERQLMSFKHEGFWQPMDTLRDKLYLEELLEKDKAPWQVWK
jgi:glucose-1-phosphate cytidylyltransferase